MRISNSNMNVHYTEQYSYAKRNGRMLVCILHIVVHHSLTATYVPNFTEIKETFCGRAYVCTYVRSDGRTFEIGFIRSTLSKSRANKANKMGLVDNKNFPKLLKRIHNVTGVYNT